MRTFQLSTLLPFLALIVFPVSAQQQSSATVATTSDPQALALVQQSLTALSASGALPSDVTLAGNATWIAGSDNEVGTATLSAMLPAFSKMSLILPSGTRSEIRNPVGSPPPGAPSGVSVPVGAWSGPDNVLHSMASHNVITDATWFFPAFTLRRLISSSNYVLSYFGQSVHNGRPLLHVSATQSFLLNVSGQIPVQAPTSIQHLSQTDIYLDPATMLPVAVDFDIHPDNDAMVDIPIEIRFSAYTAMNGTQIPFRIQRYVNNALALDIQIVTATLNSGLSSIGFQVQ